MTTAYVYAPFSGSAVSLNCYCNRAWTPDLSICSGSCANNDCRCNGTVCSSGQDCASCGDCSCRNCCWHVITQSGFQQPLDVSGSADKWIYAYLSAAIASVKVRWSANICGGGVSGDINHGTILELYAGINASGTLIGRVLYGHLKNQQHFDGKIVNKSGAMPWFVSIGQVPSTPAGQTCYLSTHLHMEGRSETGGVSRHASGCNGWLSAATSVVYSWTW